MFYVINIQGLYILGYLMTLFQLRTLYIIV
jgi:hypothetical protein